MYEDVTYAYTQPFSQPCEPKTEQSRVSRNEVGNSRQVVHVPMTMSSHGCQACRDVRHDVGAALLARAAEIKVSSGWVALRIKGHESAFVKFAKTPMTFMRKLRL
jgi:hypothetical protein